MRLRGGKENEENRSERATWIRMKDEANSAEPLPPLLESAIRAVETWWMVAVVWLINLELFWRGGLLRVLEVLLLGGRLTLRCLALSPAAVGCLMGPGEQPRQVGVSCAHGQLDEQPSAAGEDEDGVSSLSPACRPSSRGSAPPCAPRSSTTLPCVWTRQVPEGSWWLEEEAIRRRGCRTGSLLLFSPALT